MSQRQAPSPVHSWSRALQRRAYFVGGALLRSLNLYAIDLQEDALLDCARRQTGLSDFGGLEFLPGLRALIASVQTEAKLRFAAEVAERFSLIQTLKRRLHIQAHVDRKPEIREERIARPVFILAMPRSGTTLLQNLLNCDPGARWLRSWELQEPWPDVAAEAADPRRISFLRRVEEARATGSVMDRIHAVDSPADCDELFLPTFLANLHTVAKHVPSYDRWLSERSQDEWRTAYGYYRLQLQRLQSYRSPGSHWVLKSPLHLGHVPPLLATFPDARLIHVHRDPKRAVASTCSMVSVLRLETHKKVDPEEIGRFLTERLVRRVERAMEARRDLAPSQLIDVLYTDLLRDPRGTVRRIYEHFGMEMDAEMDHRMEEHLRANPQHGRGVHRYSLERFGLRAEDLDRRFESYRSSFGVPTEGRAAAVTP